MATTKQKGTPVSLVGEFVKVGSKAPDFKLVKTDFSTVTLEDFKGKRVILNIFPSLDTKVCAMSVRQFNSRAASLPDTVIIAVSKDLPFAHERFCTTNGIENVLPASDYRNYGFAEDYGVAIKDGALTGLLARAVVVIDKDGRVAYTELVPDISQEPNYDKAIDALKVY